ncbi:hypothetical protein NDA13_002007 [Ustilago tritici]|nr:hypothetical protein NDA13_002007 [Ustilago tritici]
MQGDWTSSLSLAISIDFVSVNDRRLSDTASDGEIRTPQASSFPTPPPRHIFPQETRSSYNDRLHSASDDRPFSNPRPKYLSFDRKEPSPPKRRADEANVPVTGAADLQRPLSNVGGTGSSESTVSDPLEQLKPFDPSALAHKARNEETAALSQRLITAAGTGHHNHTSFHRPRIESGLPTSYRHNLHRARSASTSSLSPSLGSVPCSLRNHGTASHHSSLPSGLLDGAETQYTSPPALVPSPALHFEGSRDQPWSSYISASFPHPSRPSSAASGYGYSHSSSVHRASSSNFTHSRGPSLATTVQTHPTSVGNSCHPSRPSSVLGIENPISSAAQDAAMRIGGRRYHHDRVRFDDNISSNQYSTYLDASRSRPILLSESSPQAQGGLPQRPPAHNSQEHEQHSQSKYRAPSLTAELVYGPRYLEPYNSCEAILLPRPRLRSRSLGSTPAIVVEKVYAAPERFWQRNVAASEADRLHVVPKSTLDASTTGHFDRLQLPSERTQLRQFPSKDARIVLHESIPPPVPPKDAALPSSRLPHTKPLPPTPTPSTPTPAASPQNDAGRASEDSIELLDASELLQRNRDLEEERQAWREEYRNSLGVNAIPLRDRLSPCLTDPSSEGSGRRHVNGSASDNTHDANVNPIRVHRVWNEDGTEQTFLIVQSKRRRTYSIHNMSISTPDLCLEGATQRPNPVRALAARFSSLTGRARGRSAAAETPKPSSCLLPTSQRSSEPSMHRKTPSHATVDTVRSFGRERKLVSNETVIIGKSPKPIQGTNNGAHVKLGALRVMTPPVAQAITRTEVHATHRAPLTGYRPPLTLDDLKAQLGDHPYSAVRQEVSAGFHAERDLSEARIRHAWIDPGASTILQDELVPTGAMQPDDAGYWRGKHKTATAQENGGQSIPGPKTSRPSPSNASVSSSDLSSSSQSGRVQSWQTAQPSRDSTVSGGSTIREPAEHVETSSVAPVDQGPAGLAMMQHAGFPAVASRHFERFSTGDSTVSSEAHLQPTLWDASTVSIDNLFFRPPPSRLPSI